METGWQACPDCQGRAGAGFQRPADGGGRIMKRHVLKQIEEAQEPEQERPDLVINDADRPETVRELRELLAASGLLFDRGQTLVQVIRGDDGTLRTKELTFN